jgi:hypothetical protein
VLPSALRTLSVVTLLGAVSGSVFLVNDHQEDHQHSAELAGSLGGGTALTSAALIPEARAARTQPEAAPAVAIAAAPALTDRAAIPFPAAAPRVETAAYVMKLRNRADAKQAAKEKAAAERKARVKAAAERRARAARAAGARASRNASRDPRALARVLVADRGWGSGQFSCLNSLWNRESGWNSRASNPSSGAYGIPQALPGSKMGTVASDWRTNPATQITWGLNYIADRYGTPCGAWGHSQSSGWY